MTRHILLPTGKRATYCGAEPNATDSRFASRRTRTLPDVCVDCVTAHEIEVAS